MRAEPVPNHNREHNPPRVAVLGGGITGLTAAYYLLRAGVKVTLLERGEQLGGLSSYFNFGPFWWDKFYHCILTSDAPLQELIRDLGLSSELHWTDTKVGFFTDNHLYSMSTTADFLRFRPLSLWAKVRLGLGVLYASRIREGKTLESILVSDWLVRVFGRENYQKMWGPLLKCKLGACREQASAAFIWATIFRLYSTRDKSAGQKERLGYVAGGYHTVVTRLIERIKSMGGVIMTGVSARRLVTAGNGIDVQMPGNNLHFDLAISTVPSHTLTSLVPEFSQDDLSRLRQVTYLGIVCAVLLLKRKLSPYYVTNLTDEDLPFTGIIEMTNLISLDETRGHHLVYLPKYTPPGDPLFETSDEQVWNNFFTHLQRVHPGITAQDVEAHFVFRERLVQPVPVIRYSDIVPAMQTSVESLLLANTTQIVNSTLNNNEMVKIARRAVELALHKLQNNHRQPWLQPQTTEVIA
jgi:protoporphyrinogen oxidase